MKKTTAGLALLVVAGLVSAQEAPGTAKSLADGCEVFVATLDGTAAQRYGAEDFGGNVLHAGRCSGYIDGFLQGYSVGRGAPESMSFCIPDGVTIPQVARLLVQRLKEQPQFEHEDRMVVMLGLLRGTWPCQPQPGNASHQS